MRKARIADTHSACDWEMPFSFDLAGFLVDDGGVRDLDWLRSLSGDKSLPLGGGARAATNLSKDGCMAAASAVACLRTFTSSSASAFATKNALYSESLAINVALAFAKALSLSLSEREWRCERPSTDGERERDKERLRRESE